MTGNPLPVYKILAAEKKIIDIAKWSANKWGKEAARHYLGNIERIINLVATGLLPTEKKSEFSERFTFCLAQQHYIFFEIRGDKLIIATLFHTAMAIKGRINEEQLGLLNTTLDYWVSLQSSYDLSHCQPKHLDGIRAIA